MMKYFQFLLLLTPGMFASETNILPSAFPVTRYQQVWENSPFNREVVAQIGIQNQSNFAKNLVLEGMVTDQNEGTIAYLRDLTDNSFLVIKSKKAEGSSLYVVEATKSKNPAETSVTISDGTETAEIKYAEGIYTSKIDAPPAAPERQGSPSVQPGRESEGRSPNQPAAEGGSVSQENPPPSNGPPGVIDSLPPGVTSEATQLPASNGPPTDGGPPIERNTSGRGISLLPIPNRPSGN